MVDLMIDLTWYSVNNILTVLTLQMVSRWGLLAKELSCKQASHSSCHCLHFTSNSVSVCVLLGYKGNGTTSISAVSEQVTKLE